jgi:hypothetical protein
LIEGGQAVLYFKGLASYSFERFWLKLVPAIEIKMQRARYSAVKECGKDGSQAKFMLSVQV